MVERRITATVLPCSICPATSSDYVPLIMNESILARLSRVIHLFGEQQSACKLYRRASHKGEIKRQQASRLLHHLGVVVDVHRPAVRLDLNFPPGRQRDSSRSHHCSPGPRAHSISQRRGGLGSVSGRGRAVPYDAACRGEMLRGFDKGDRER